MTSVDSQPARTVTLANVSVAQLLLRYLAMEGATTLFGIPGAAVMEVAYQLRVQADSFATSSAATKRARPTPRTATPG